ncbi:MAG: glycosyltransferase family 4 protein [Halorhodospira sp.]
MVRAPPLRALPPFPPLPAERPRSPSPMSNDKDRALHIAHFVNLGQVGGVESRMLSVARRLHPDRKHAGIVLTDHLHPQWFSQWPAEGLIRRPQKRWGPLRLPEGGWIHRQLLRSRLRQERQPDIALLWGLFPTSKVLNALRVEKLPICYMECGSAWRSKPGGRLAEGIWQVDQIITNSNASKRMLQLGWGLDEKATVLLNPLRPEAAPPEPRAAGPRNPDAPLRLGLVGRCLPFKGFELALHAVRLLRDQGVRLTVALAGDGPERPHLEELAAELGLGETIRFRGNVTDMTAFYRELDLFVCPSLREPFGLVSLEAQSWGVPVIVAGIDGLPETVHDGTTGTVVPPELPPSTLGDYGIATVRLPRWVYDPRTDALVAPHGVAPATLAAAIRSYAEDEPRRQAHGTAASQWAFQHFHIDGYVARLSALLRSIAPGTR